MDPFNQLVSAFGGEPDGTGVEQDPEVLALAAELGVQREKATLQADPAPVDEPPQPQANTQPEAALQPDAPTEAPAQPQTERSIDDLLNDPAIQRLLSQREQEARQREQAELAAARQRELLNALPDDQLGQFVRRQQHEQQVYAQVFQQVAGHVANEAYRQVMEMVPEAKAAPAEVQARIEKAQSFGEVFNVLADHAASVRAQKIAKELAAKEVEAAKAQFVQEYTRNVPVAPTSSGSPAPAAQGSPIGNFNPLDGTKLLLAAFADS